MSAARSHTLIDDGWTLADTLGDMVSTHAPDGTYRYASAAAHELLGLDPADLIGLWAYDLYHPDDVAKLDIAHRSALNGAPYTVAYRIRHRAGHYVWVETTTRSITATSGDIVEFVCSTRALADRGIASVATDADREAQLDRVTAVLDAEAIEPAYQPIVELETGTTIGFEALARFPGDPTYPVKRWFEDAWEVGLGTPIEALAARKGLSALARLPKHLWLSVNASPPTAVSNGFLSLFDDDISRVAIEVTEHIDVVDYDELTMRLVAFRSAGGRIAVDDFGAGHASLRHIVRVQPNWIKLDMSLTKRVDRNAVVRALVRSLVDFADTIGVGVIAEGVESRDELDALLTLGVTHGQGFLFGTPAGLDVTLARAGV